MLFKNICIVLTLLSVVSWSDSINSQELQDTHPHSVLISPIESFIIGGAIMEYRYYHSLILGELQADLGYGNRGILSHDSTSWIVGAGYRFSGSESGGWYVNATVDFYTYRSFVYDNSYEAHLNQSQVTTEWKSVLHYDCAVGYLGIFDTYYLLEVSFSPLSLWMFSKSLDDDDLSFKEDVRFSHIVTIQTGVRF
ncbi:MAG: hypothetical protein OCD01_14560 [Fibrobacterales bacterium]